LSLYVANCGYYNITNRKDPEYFKELGSAVSDMRESVKDIVYGKKIRNFKVLEPVSLLATEEDDEAAAAKLMPYFKEDPVHLSADGYAEILQGLLDFIFEGSFTRTPKPAFHPSTSQTRRDWSRSRKNWVNQDDTVAKRSDLVPQKKFQMGRGRGSGGHGGRGGGRGGRGGHDYGRGVTATLSEEATSAPGGGTTVSNPTNLLAYSNI
jgi:hypothetical protein